MEVWSTLFEGLKIKSLKKKEQWIWCQHGDGPWTPSQKGRAAWGAWDGDWQPRGPSHRLNINLHLFWPLDFKFFESGQFFKSSNGFIMFRFYGEILSISKCHHYRPTVRMTFLSVCMCVDKSFLAGMKFTSTLFGNLLFPVNNISLFTMYDT